MAKPHKPLSTLGILREALILPKNNKKLILYVFLIALVTATVLCVVNQLTIQPVLMDLVSKSSAIRNLDPMSPLYSVLLAAIRKDIREVAVMEVVFAAVAFFVGVVMKTLIIYASAVAYTQQAQTLKEALWMVIGMFKGPLLTQLLVALLSSGYLALLSLLVAVLVFISNSSIIGLLIVSLVSLSASVWLVYLVALWSLSVVVSVLEQGRYGLGAINRARELWQGRKWKAVAIVLLSLVLACVVSMVYMICYTRTSHSFLLQMAVVFEYLVLMEVLSVYIIGAFTVYYYECRRCLGEEPLVTSAGNFVYTTLDVDDV